MSLGIDELRKKLKDLGVYHDLYCKDNISKPDVREQE
jgi:hypothetical protein